MKKFRKEFFSSKILGNVRFFGEGGGGGVWIFVCLRNVISEQPLKLSKYTRKVSLFENALRCIYARGTNLIWTRI